MSASPVLPQPIPSATSTGAPARRFAMTAPMKMAGQNRTPSRSRIARDARRRPHERRKAGGRVERESDACRHYVDADQPDDFEYIDETLAHEVKLTGPGRYGYAT